MNRVGYDKRMNKFNDMRRSDPRFIFARRVAMVFTAVMGITLGIVSTATGSRVAKII